MPYFSFKNIKISCIASAVPSSIVRVSDFAPVFGSETVRKFSESTGIKQFRKTKKYQTASDLCFAAAEKIINKQNINREDIKALVFIAHSTDYRRPATACVLHKRLGLSKDCTAFDVSLGCSAFVYGLMITCSLMQNSNINKALLLVGETLTKMTNPKDKSVAMLFGDGGGAILLEKTDDCTEINGLLKTDGMGYKDIIAPAGGFRNFDASSEDFEWEDGCIRNLYNTIMNGQNVFSFTISDVPKTVRDFLDLSNTTIEDFDCFAFHQANKLISQMLCKKLKIDPCKMPLCLDRYGNTSAPSIPLVICDKYGDENDNTKLSIMMCGFGVGLSWGVCSAKISVNNILPIIETDILFEEGIINCPEDL